RKALERLGLGVPPIAWHASRDTIAEFVSLLALIGGTLARIANEVVQLQRSEIMELEEPFAHGKVGSSTMPHKRNPTHAERIVAIGRLLRGLAATALESMVAAHERDMSVGRAEWVLVPEAACLAAATEHWSLVVARGLRVNVGRMKENVQRLGGLLLSEAVMLKLGETLGRNAAHDLVYEAAMTAFDGKGRFRELVRPPGAGCLVGSGAVGDDEAGRLDLERGDAGLELSRGDVPRVRDADRALRVRRGIAHVEDDRPLPRRLEQAHHLRRADAVAVSSPGEPPHSGIGAEARDRHDHRNGGPRERLWRRILGLGRHAADVGKLGDEPIGLGEVL